MIDKQSYLMGVEDVLLILRDELKRIKNKEIRKILRKIIESVEEKKLWMAKKRLL